MVCLSRAELHPDKTVVFIKTVNSKVSWKRVKLLNETVDIKAELKSIGVFLDNSLYYRKHIAAVTFSCYFQLRKLLSTRRFLNFESRHMLIRTCVLSRLEYSYSLLAGVCAKDLQKVQNYSCRFIYGLHRSSSTFFHRHDLHWLTIQQKVKFKLLCFLYKALFNAELLPPYLSVFQFATGKRSSDSRKLVCPKKRNAIGCTAFDHIGATEISRQSYGFQEKIESASVSTALLPLSTRHF